MLRARVTRDTQNPAVIRARTSRELALLRLKQYLDLPPDAELRLAESLADEVVTPAPLFAARLAAADAATVPAVARAAVQEVATTVRLREGSLTAVKAERMPSVSATSTYGRAAYPSNFVPVFNRVNRTLGVSVQVPDSNGRPTAGG